MLKVLYYIYAGGTLSIDLTISIMMLCFFLGKLYHGIKITQFIDSTNITSGNTSIQNKASKILSSFGSQPLSRENSNSNNKYTSDVKIYSKVSTLSIAITISTEFTLISLFVDTILFYTQSETKDIVHDLPQYAMLADSILKSYFISLFFIFGNNCYNKICGYCDNKIRQCCIKQINKRIHSIMRIK